MSADLPLPGPLVAAAAGRVRFAEPPAPLRAALDARFDSWAATRRGRPWRAAVTAVLASATGTGPIVAGLRGAATDRARQLLYTTDVAEIALHLREHGSVATIDGQVLPLADDLDDVVVVELWRGDERCASVDTDDSGSFVLEDVVAGTYRLTVAWLDLEIGVGPVEVESAG